MRFKLPDVSILLLCVCLLPLSAEAEWRGQFYGGVGGGLQQNALDIKMQNIFIDNKEAYSTVHQFSNNKTQMMSNIFVGWGARQGPYYLGLEGDVYYAPQKVISNYPTPLDFTNHSIESQMSWRYELSGLVGYYFTPQWLTYGKLGLTALRLKANYQAIDTQTDTLSSTAIADQTLYGGVLGIGVRYALDQHWHVGAEADYIQYANSSKYLPDSTFLNKSQPYTFQYHLSQYLVKATLSYMF